MVDYKYIENLLVRLLSLLVNVFSESECKEVQDFIDAGEYGLALDTLIDIVDEESKTISQEVLDLTKQAAVAMELDDKGIEARLVGFVADN